MNYRNKAKKLVRKFAKEMKVDNKTAAQLVASHLFNTMAAVHDSEFTDDEKTNLIQEYFNTLNALNDETIYTDMLSKQSAN